MTVQSSIALLVAANLVFASGAPIGIAKSGGEFRLDNVSVRSNTTIFDGSTLESGVSRSDLNLNNGARLMLTANSRGKVYTDRVVLEQGATELAGANKYRVEALSLKVIPDSSASVAQVSLSNSKRVVVAAKGGAVKVTNASGVLVARVFPGAALEFDPNASGASTATKISGTLQKKNGKLFLKDGTTNVVFEVRGAEVDKYAGKTVVVTGTTVSGAAPSGDASQVLNATKVTPDASGKKKAAAVAGAGGAAGTAGAAAGGAAAAGTVAGMSTGVFVAVVGGVAAAGTLGGLAGTGVIGGDDKPVSRP